MSGALTRRGHRRRILAPEGAGIHQNLPKKVDADSCASISSLDFPSRFVDLLKDQDIQKIVMPPYDSGLETWQLNEICKHDPGTPDIYVKMGLPPYTGPITTATG